MVRKTHRRKTHRRKSHTKRKTSRRHRKGGRAIQPNNEMNVNRGNGNRGNGNIGNGMNINIPINNQNDEFEDRLGNLINTLQDIIDSIDRNNEQKEHYINEILALLPEAREIDHYYNNDDMEQQVVQKIADILIQYDPNLEERNYNSLCNNVRRNYIHNN